MASLGSFRTGGCRDLSSNWGVWGVFNSSPLNFRVLLAAQPNLKGRRMFSLVPVSADHGGDVPPPPLRHHALQGSVDVHGADEGIPALPPQPLGLARHLLVDVLHEADHEPLGLVGEEPAVSLDLVERLGADGAEGALRSPFPLLLHGLMLHLAPTLPLLGWRSPAVALLSPSMLDSPFLPESPSLLGPFSSPSRCHGTALSPHCPDPAALQTPPTLPMLCK